MSKTFLLIDSSYFNFFRFFATKSWYMRDAERVKLNEGVEWIDNQTYMKTYQKMWFETVKKLQKMFNPDRTVFARDGNNIWRYKIHPEYKANRVDCEPSETEISGPGAIFKFTNENYHSLVNGSAVIRVHSAEADDIIAVAVDYLQSSHPGCIIIIISSDHDLLQLCRPGVEIYNLKGKKFTNITTEDPIGSKMEKILSGDPSDNIKGAFPRCGKKTAIKLYKDPQLLQTWIGKHGDSQYKLNCMLIDFANIPSEVKDEIKKALDNCFQII